MAGWEAKPTMSPNNTYPSYVKIGFDDVGLHNEVIKELRFLRSLRAVDHESFHLQSWIDLSKKKVPFVSSLVLDVEKLPLCFGGPGDVGRLGLQQSLNHKVSKLRGRQQ